MADDVAEQLLSMTLHGADVIIGDKLLSKGGAQMDVEMSELLTQFPPGAYYRVKPAESNRLILLFVYPPLELYCHTCDGVQWFATEPQSVSLFRTDDVHPQITAYRCRNCRQQQKHYALLFIVGKQGTSNAVVKFGEDPPFGPPVPKRVKKLVGDGRVMFLKGYRCVNQSLGIGAMAYLRRVVEGQWARLLGKIIEVAKQNAVENVSALLEAAKEHRFTRSVEMAKDHFPVALFISGMNPMQLLYDVVSINLHESSEEECLAGAAAINRVLIGLADRIDNILTEDRELADAAKQLNQLRTDKRAQKKKADSEPLHQAGSGD